MKYYSLIAIKVNRISKYSKTAKANYIKKKIYDGGIDRKGVKVLMRRLAGIIAVFLLFCCLLVGCDGLNQEKQTTVTYKIEHYQEKLDGTYELKDTESQTVDLGEEITENAYTLKTYEGFTFDSGNTNNVKTGKATKEGLTIKLYYKRNLYTVTFNAMGGQAIQSQQVKYGGKVQKPSMSMKHDASYDYELKSWQNGSTDWNFETDVVTGNIELVAVWEKAGTKQFLP